MAAAAERAIDDDLARLGIEKPNDFVGQNRNVTRGSSHSAMIRTPTCGLRGPLVSPPVLQVRPLGAVPPDSPSEL